MKNSFDLLSSIYDLLARLAFGKKWDIVQRSPAEILKDKQEILIVGGGTGKLLEHLHKQNRVTYVELSEKMIKRAQARTTEADVTFVHADYLIWKSTVPFDVVLFPFFLDLFHADHLRLIISQAKRQLKATGELHVIDFRRSGVFRNSLVKMMYLFFRVSANLEARRLLNLDREVRTYGFSPLNTREFFGGWVFYRIYRLL